MGAAKRLTEIGQFILEEAYARLACQTGTGREGGGGGGTGEEEANYFGTRFMAITVRYPQKISLFFDSAQLLLAITFKGNWSEGCKILR